MINFDAHSDLLTRVTMKRLRGEKNIIQKYHLERLKQGNVLGTILAVWIDPPFADKDPTWRMLEILGAMCEEISDMRGCAGVVSSYDDLAKIQESGRIAIILGIEGLSGLRGNASLVSMLYRLGIRHAMLTWNEENEFATGVKSPHPERGLTAKGIEVLRKMETLGMVVDVSHANEKTFWDVYEVTHKPFIASHSNVYNICPVPRNLKDEQIKAIAERRGVIGMNACPDFVDETCPTAEALAKHVDYIVNLVGIDYVGLGFDFCNYLAGDTPVYFHGELSAPLNGLEDVTKVPHFINLLMKNGYRDEDIEKITHKNMERVLKEIL